MRAGKKKTPNNGIPMDLHPRILTRDRSPQIIQSLLEVHFLQKSERGECSDIASIKVMFICVFSEN